MDRNFVRFAAFVLGLCAAGAVALLLVMTLLGMAGCSSGDASSTWPESTEFSELETGQDRWSWHGVEGPGLRKWYVVVDRSTGAEYLYAAGAGLCPLLAADGTPLRVLEAGG